MATGGGEDVTILRRLNVMNENITFWNVNV